MNAAKRDHSGIFRPNSSTGKGFRNRAKTVRISTTGVTFSTPKYIAPFTEVQVQLRGAKSAEPIQCSGVVVDCHGDKTAHQYNVSVAFVNIPRDAERKLRHTSNPASNEVHLASIVGPGRVSS